MIDIDGPGDARPVKVMCKMEQIPAVHIITLREELEEALSSCSDPGCHAVDVVYKTPMDDIVAVKEHSVSCSQTIGVLCTNAPIFNKTSNTPMIWWEDVNSNPVPYWTGNDTHRCQCGMHSACVDISKRLMKLTCF